ncbi:hypothetical protein F4777DRAFT_456846 [Nemania sp. FL0916]|nr:hypothetical protein F4777DRAFT_456846 [Nemania sp. FL0916]
MCTLIPAIRRDISMPYLSTSEMEPIRSTGFRWCFAAAVSIMRQAYHRSTRIESRKFDRREGPVGLKNDYSFFLDVVYARLGVLLFVLYLVLLTWMTTSENYMTGRTTGISRRTGALLIPLSRPAEIDSVPIKDQISLGDVAMSISSYADQRLGITIIG